MTVTHAVTVSLPFPLGVNNLYLNLPGRGRVLSPKYRAWQTETQWMLIEQGPSRIAGPFHASILVSRPDKRKRDIDGLVKCCLDAIVKAGIVEDDSLAESVSIAWAPGIVGAQVSLTKH